MLCKLIATTLCGERQVCFHPSFRITWLPGIITCCFSILDHTTVIACCSGRSCISNLHSSALCLMQPLLIPDVRAIFMVVPCFPVLYFLVKALLIVAHVGFYLEFSQHSISFEQYFFCDMQLDFSCFIPLMLHVRILPAV